MVLTFTIGGIIAVFHVGVEQTWWEGTKDCIADTTASNSLDELRKKIMEAPIVRCTEVQWSLFNISMAGYNLLISVALAVFSAFAVFYSRNIDIAFRM